MFINYDPNTGFSINTSRQPRGYANDDVTGLVDDVMAERCGCCPLEGAKAALEDGHVWQGSSVSYELIEEIHDVITQWEDGRRALGLSTDHGQ